MQDLLKYLNYRPQSVSPQEYRAWLDNPCTKELKHELITAFIADVEIDTPVSIDASVPFIHQREGFRSTLRMISGWEPESVKEARSEVDGGTLEEVDSE